MLRIYLLPKMLGPCPGTLEQELMPGAGAHALHCTRSAALPLLVLLHQC